MCHTGFLTACSSANLYDIYIFCVSVQGKLSANLYDIYHCVQCKTADDIQRNCPKHVEDYSKNKFDKLMHLVGFIVRIYHDARSPECQINL